MTSLSRRRRPTGARKRLVIKTFCTGFVLMASLVKTSEMVLKN